MPSSSEKRYCYYIKSCPLHYECNDQAWRKANWCKSYESEWDAKMNLYDHLLQTERHKQQSARTLWNVADKAKVVLNKVERHGYPKVDSPLICDSMHMCDRSNAWCLHTFHIQVLQELRLIAIFIFTSLAVIRILIFILHSRRSLTSRCRLCGGSQKDVQSLHLGIALASMLT